MLRQTKRLISTAFIFTLILGLGFIVGLTHGLQNNSRSSLTQIHGQSHPLCQTRIKIELPEVEFRQGSAPKLFIALRSPQTTIPRDIAPYLRLQLAQPGGWDHPRAIVEPNMAVFAASDNGCAMNILIPLSAFQKNAGEKISSHFALQCIGDHEIRISIDWNRYLRRANSASTTPSRPLLQYSNPVSFTVIRNDLETVNAPKRRSPLRFLFENS
jgi:hypothetical protein